MRSAIYDGVTPGCAHYERTYSITTMLVCTAFCGIVKCAWHAPGCAIIDIFYMKFTFHGDRSRHAGGCGNRECITCMKTHSNSEKHCCSQYLHIFFDGFRAGSTIRRIDHQKDQNPSAKVVSVLCFSTKILRLRTLSWIKSPIDS